MKKISILLLMGSLLWTSHSKGQVILQALDAPDTQPPFHLPNGVTLKNYTHFVASIYDNDYLPYTLPTAPADWTSYDAGGGTDPLIDVQGKITTQGTEILIPIETTGTGTIPAGRFTTQVPASKTEDGQARTLELSWNDTPFTNDTYYITATLKSLVGDLNVKKLDVNRGVGNDYKGVELATFNINTPSTITVRATAGVPDKMFGIRTNGKLEHQFIYVPIITATGKVWLNNNLGADYANVNSSHFGPMRQAGYYDLLNGVLTEEAIRTDFRAYGSLFLYNRNDGGELVDWKNKVNGTWVHSKNRSYDVFTRRNLTPCPNGFRLPTYAELDAETRKGSGVSSFELWMASGLRLSAAGSLEINRNPRTSTAYVNQIYNPGYIAYYWGNSSNLSMTILPPDVYVRDNSWGYLVMPAIFIWDHPGPVRCIAD